ncbi:hypothetical protein BN946_scf184981.g3 [Trametes cinnabarina]|uniref:A-kinase anchor protein 7-like phosphoesterase domain-containing protein n=1 Tax=Pycnoporus cinnabarinus TaxID=5643 RepID=A0A060SU38_PYCCI|nr:hypothetical protein BN946_scf184981.g3 [Trametes cinnabarina]
MESTLPVTAHAPNPSGGRGRGRGRGGRRGRGRGVQTGEGPEHPPSGSSSRPPRAPKPPLTHFIALPIGHHARLRETMQTFANGLLASTPPIPGLDRTIIVPPRRLHFTLGVMSLDKEAPATAGGTPQRTLEAAKRVLDELKPKIAQVLGQEKLRVKLDSMDIMKPERRDPERANVMWIGPSPDGESARRLKTVADLIAKAFADAGLVVDEKRPLKARCF